MAAEYGSIPDLKKLFDDQPADVVTSFPCGFNTTYMKGFIEAPVAVDFRKCLVSGYGDPNIERGGGGVGDTDRDGHFGSGAGHDVEGHGHIIYYSHLGSGGGAGSEGHTSFAMGALTDVSFDQIRFLLTSAAVYFATLGFTNTIIAHDVRGDSNGTHSIITDLVKGNHMFFQMFTLVNIFGFATTSGALLIRVGKGKLKSGVICLVCSIIAFLCMALSFSVLVFVCVFVSLDALAITGSNG